MSERIGFIEVGKVLSKCIRLELWLIDLFFLNIDIIIAEGVESGKYYIRPFNLSLFILTWFRWDRSLFAIYYYDEERDWGLELFFIKIKSIKYNRDEFDYEYC